MSKANRNQNETFHTSSVSSQRSKASSIRSSNKHRLFEEAANTVVINEDTFKQTDQSDQSILQNLSILDPRNEEDALNNISYNSRTVSTMLGKLGMVGIVMVDDDDDSNSTIQQPQFPHYVWGSSNRGQLGSQEQLIIEPRQTTIPNIKRISMVACGGSHTLIVSETGSLFAMGDNLSGQLGVGLKVTMASEPMAVEFFCKL